MTVTRTSPAAIAQRIARRRDRAASAHAPAEADAAQSVSPDAPGPSALIGDEEECANNVAAWRRKSFVLPTSEARAIVSAWLDRYPQARWRSEIENWRVIGDDLVQFTMRRLPEAEAASQI